MKITITKGGIIALGLLSTTLTFAQEVEKVDTLQELHNKVTILEDANESRNKLKITGYIQAQWQDSQLDSLGKKTSDMKVGGDPRSSEAMDINRFGIRRGRLKTTYEDQGAQAVLELDINEKSVKVKTASISVTEQLFRTFSLKGGIFDRPFGYECEYSSSRLESPERSRITQTLFPDENDLGAMLTIQAPKTSTWNPLKLEAGLFGGNAISQDLHNKKDFIGHLTYRSSTSSIKYGVGLGYYLGAVCQANNNVYTATETGFTLNNATSNKDGYAKREYIGFDGQFSVSTGLGLTSLRGEYIFGTQPGSSSSTKSPTETATITGDTYIRNFTGGYVHFVQDLGQTKHSVTAKYDWYDPNTLIAGTQVGTVSKSGKADIAYSTIGLGYIYRMNNNVRLSAYYDIVANELTSVKGFFTNTTDNLVTLRMQYKF